jgi:hypothetical protein
MVNTKTMGHVFRHPNYYKQLKEKYEKEASSIKHQAGDNDLDPTRGVGPEAGVKTKHQAASIKRQAASLKHVPRYVASDYKATSIKRQALTKIPQN